MTTMPYFWLATLAQHGHLGVYLFFMISGFVILMTARDDLPAFLISRASRLYPAFWACCTLTFLAIVALGAPRFTASIWRYVANLSMLGEFIGVANIDGVYWSIFVEIRFYLLVAILIAFKQIKNIERFMWAWLGLVLLEAFWPTPVIQRIFITAHAPFFVAGAVFYGVFEHGWKLGRAAMLGVCLALSTHHVLAGLDGFNTYYNTFESPWITAGMILAFYALMTAVSMRKTGWVGRQNWTTLGALTYPLYLLHQNVSYILFNHLYPALNPHLVFWSVFFSMLLMAHLIHIGVERPLGQLIRNKAHEFLAKRRQMPAVQSH